MAGVTLFKILFDLEFADVVEVDVFADPQLDAGDGIVVIEVDIEVAAEQQVFGVARGKIQADDVLAVFDSGVADKVHVKSRGQHLLSG